MESLVIYGFVVDKNPTEGGVDVPFGCLDCARKALDVVSFSIDNWLT